jgi:hypothetical protein
VLHTRDGFAEAQYAGITLVRCKCLDGATTSPTEEISTETGNFEEISAANEVIFSTSSVEAGGFLSLYRIDVSGGLGSPV